MWSSSDTRRLRLASGTELTADQIVIAAGGRPIIPEIDGLDDIPSGRKHTSDTVMRVDDLPTSMVIVGGGVIAAEMAHIFSALGTRVSIVAYTEHLLRHEDEDVSAAFTDLASSRWDVRTERTATAIERTPDGVRLHVEDAYGNADGHIDAEMVLIAVGRVSNADRLGLDTAGIEVHDDGRIVVDDYQRTTADGVFALGDVSSEWELKHVANHEARIVQYNLTHPDAMEKADHRFVPHAVFSDPQVASVGKTERELVDGRHGVRRQDPAVRRRRLRLGDGGHHRLREGAGRPVVRTDSRCSPARRGRLQPDPADRPGDELRALGA